MREWLSGRALPCQGKCREFESRLPLHFFYKRGLTYQGKELWHHSQAVRLGSAKPSSTVRFRVVPPICRSGGIGRRKGLKIPRRHLRAGSSPASGTNLNFQTLVLGFFLFYMPNFTFAKSCKKRQSFAE